MTKTYNLKAATDASPAPSVAEPPSHGHVRAKFLAEYWRRHGGSKDDGEVLRTEGHFVFTVASRRMTEPPHRVDLEAHKFNGACDCENFLLKLAPHARRARHPGDDTRCHHIRQARQFFLNWWLIRLSKRFGVLSGKGPK